MDFLKQFCAMRTKHYINMPLFPLFTLINVIWLGYCYLDEKHNQLWNIHRKFTHGEPLQTCTVNDNQCGPASRKRNCGLIIKCLIWLHNTSILNSLYCRKKVTWNGLHHLPQCCTFCMFSLSDAPISGLRVSANELMT